MAITHSTGAKNAAANAVVDLLDVGAGANGTLVIKTSGDAVLVTINLAEPAFGAASGGVAAISGTPNGVATGAGVAAKFDLKDEDGTVVISGTVGQGSGDISLDNTNIAVDQTVTISTMTYTPFIS